MSVRTLMRTTTSCRLHRTVDPAVDVVGEVTGEAVGGEATVVEGLGLPTRGLQQQSDQQGSSQQDDYLL